MTTTTGSETDMTAEASRQRVALNFASIVCGRLFSALSMWLALVLLTKMADPATVGLYALAQAICIPVAELAKLSLREIRSSDVSGSFLLGDYFGLRLSAMMVGFALMLGFTLIQSETPAMIWVMVFYALTRCVELVSDLIYALFQSQERMEYIGRSLCIAGPLSLVFLVAGYWLTDSLVVAVIGQLTAHLATLVFHDLPVGRRRARIGGESLRPRWGAGALRALSLKAVPLALATLLILLALYLPRVVIEYELGLSALGIFAVILALAMAPDRLVNAMGIALSVRLARHAAAGRRGAFLKLLFGMAGGIAVFGALGLAICSLEGEAILRLVYTESYAVHGDLLMWLVAAAVLRSIANILRFGLIAVRRFWWLGLQNAAAASVAVAGCLILIPRFGLPGAGATMVCVFATQLVVVLVALGVSLKSTDLSGSQT